MFKNDYKGWNYGPTLGYLPSEVMRGGQDNSKAAFLK